jgi:Spy/CpxP family protein refolding chaperone
MRNFMLTAAVLAAAWSPSFGQSAATQPAMPPYYVIRMPGVGEGMYEEFVKATDLTLEQQRKFVKIETQRAQENKDKDKTLEDTRAAMIKAYGTGDHDTICKAMGEFGKANSAVYESQNKAQAEMLALITPEQKAKWQEFMVLRNVRYSFYGTKFDDKQWDKIIAAYEKLAKDSTATTMQLQARLIAQMETFLTPEQKMTRVKARYAMMNKIVHFTDEQLQKLLKIDDGRAKAWSDLQDQVLSKSLQLAKSMADAQASGDQATMAALQEQSAEIYKPYSEFEKQFQDKVQAVLTDNQKKAWADQLKAAPKPFTVSLPAGGNWPGTQTGKH